MSRTTDSIGPPPTLVFSTIDLTYSWQRPAMYTNIVPSHATRPLRYVLIVTAELFREQAVDELIGCAGGPIFQECFRLSLRRFLATDLERGLFDEAAAVGNRLH